MCKPEFKPCIMVIAAVCCFVAITGLSQEPESRERTLVIGARHIPPFAIKRQDGSWGGLSIDLWREIAAENDWEFEVRELPLSDLLAGVKQGELDAVVAAVTVTHDREEVMDFTHPFHSSGLGIAVRKSHRASWLSGLVDLLAWEFVVLLICLGMVTVGLGLLMWLVERRHNEEHFGYAKRHRTWHLVGGRDDDNRWLWR